MATRSWACPQSTPRRIPAARPATSAWDANLRNWTLLLPWTAQKIAFSFRRPPYPLSNLSIIPSGVCKATPQHVSHSFWQIALFHLLAYGSRPGVGLDMLCSYFCVGMLTCQTNCFFNPIGCQTFLLECRIVTKVYTNLTLNAHQFTQIGESRSTVLMRHYEFEDIKWDISKNMIGRICSMIANIWKHWH